jgi:fatty-acyl-CoA synthase
MLEGLMQNDYPLSLRHPLERMRTVYGDRTIATLEDPARLPDGGVTHATYAEVGERVDRLARVLDGFGLQPGDRVATFGWNSQRHFELYYAVPCSGYVLHTLNIRLFAEQIEYIVNHADDQVIFVDDTLTGLLAPLADRMPNVKHFVVMGDGDDGGLPNVLRYEELLAAAGPGAFDYPEVEERAAAALCYTSGTTGNPKGVLYSHRSICLHAMAICMADNNRVSVSDSILPIVPMFHVNAWGVPFAAALTGASLVMPTRFLQAEPLAALIAAERPTILNGVPTVMNDLLRYADEHAPDLSSVKRGLCGGSAVPVGLMRGFQERHGIEILQGWGMTETSPVCSVALPPDDVEVGSDEYWRLRAGQGRVSPWVEMRVVGDDGPQPWDGESVGEIQVRGPWIASQYYGATDEENDEKFDGPWLRTGDIGTVDSRGYVQLTDRAKDLIKSGGEWISSVELETEIMAHPGVFEAAVIARPDPRWAERPLACVVLEEDVEVSAADIRTHLEARVAKWWVPEEVVFIEEVPKTSVGKFDKKVLRARLEVGELIPADE